MLHPFILVTDHGRLLSLSVDHDRPEAKTSVKGRDSNSAPASSL